jgi:CRISPR-associated exonuclease Cas4
MYCEQDWVPLSALQHFLFCPRQCSLNYVEKVWIENYLTAAGRILHHKTEDFFKESRKGIVHEFGVEIASSEFCVFGQVDVVEYHFDRDDRKKLVAVIPIEYKRGKEKKEKSDEVQLCAQGLCLEDMTKTPVNYGFLFYFSSRERKRIEFSKELKEITLDTINAVRSLYALGTNPPAEYKKGCNSCSMREMCFPKTAGRGKSVNRYIGQRAFIEEDG